MLDRKRQRTAIVRYKGYYVIVQKEGRVLLLCTEGGESAVALYIRRGECCCSVQKEVRVLLLYKEVVESAVAL